MSRFAVLTLCLVIGFNIQKVDSQHHYCPTYYTAMEVKSVRRIVCGAPSYPGPCVRTIYSYGTVIRINTTSCCTGWTSYGCNIPVCHDGCGNQGECVGPDECVCYIGFEGNRCQYYYDATSTCSILGASVEPQTFYPYIEKTRNGTRCWVITGSPTSGKEEDDKLHFSDLTVRMNNITTWPDDCLRNSLQIKAERNYKTEMPQNDTEMREEICGRQTLLFNGTDVYYILIQIAAVADHTDNSTDVGIEYYIDRAVYNAEEIEQTTKGSDPVSPSTVFEPNDINHSTHEIDVRPNYGPEAGGTTITMHGTDLPLDSVVLLGDSITCKTIYRNSSTLLVITPRLRDMVDVVGKPLQIKLVVSLSHVLDTLHVFEYKENPVIENVYPRDTIVDGGTQITVLGSNMNSIASVTMTTTMVIKEIVQAQPTLFNLTSTYYESMCTVVNHTQLICLTPHIDLPLGFVSESSRKRRETPRNTQPMFVPHKQSNLQHPDGRVDLFQTKSRVKRNVQIYRSRDGDIVEFYIGFNMDGVDNYQNYTTIEVFVGPEFNIDPIVHKYIKNKPLSFQGKYLNLGVTVHDYNITVGQKQCIRMELLSNALSCFPPVEQPEVDKDNDQIHPKIMIHVGVHIEYMAGYLSYTESTLPRFAIILTAVSITCTIVLIIVIAVVCASKRKKAS